ncbi:Mob1/phocein [Syncephalis fuscata]|nr:Mob1/phocein [Syncephalis fuscata]
MSFISKLTSKTKSKRPDLPSSQPLFLQRPFVHASVANGSFRKFVGLPKYTDENEWLATNTFDFFHNLNLFYAAVSEFCTPHECSVMGAGTGVEYTWTDSQRRNVKLPAPHYIDYVTTWIQNLLDDETIFPTRAGKLPLDGPSSVKQLFRVFAHIYWTHYDKLIHLCLEGHFNSLFAHYMAFSREFDLLEKKELTPLNELIAEMEAAGKLG